MKSMMMSNGYLLKAVTTSSLLKAVTSWCDYEQQIQVAVINDEPMVDQIPLEAMNLSLVIVMCKS